MCEKIFIPKIKEATVFKEIAMNVINPLEIIREGLSNSYDADSKNISITVDRSELGEFTIGIKDDGKGMDINTIHKFFNLGDSNKEKLGIGEKGLGTKTYFKSNRIIVRTRMLDKEAFEVVMDTPWMKLMQSKVPEYTVNKLDDWGFRQGTEIVIVNYQIDIPERYFNYETLRDYILWFTAGGNFKNLFANNINLQKRIKNMFTSPSITIYDNVYETSGKIPGVHQFFPPQEMPELVDSEVKYKRSINYCRHFGPFHRETNINGKHVSVQLYGTVSGFNCRKSICKLRQGETHKSRFGLYLSKDFIPFIKKSELLGDEQYYHYHLLANSQNFELTADRNNLSNEEHMEIKWIYEQIKDIFNKYIKPLAEREYFTIRKKEEEEHEIRCKFESIRKNFANLERLDDLLIDSIPIQKRPRCEYEVALLFISLITNLDTRIFFDSITKVVSYSTKSSTDMICLDKNNGKVLVEVEYRLSKIFEHKHPIGTYDYVICWDIDIEENKMNELYGVKAVLVSRESKTVIVSEDNIEIEVIELKGIVNKIISCNLNRIAK
ncbi:ATP-binding protein [Clostridium magnum]|uniref:Histidine kinase-, DNA gyrase B-, and HSP90-like ATPase n=1 Tax=Clostridium magnum DSM 2767 TaxID=1121326 RepID=A0A162SPJ1_9CLOT|nr:ATP-binding protein [Clostridium magnum]KZL91700.1 histidine kinase-, DNA gyrase B-, and HSP90-like ATPase [Clostridium magnum DSM 2767]SHJ39571.1 Histidine kinase-, DNA gyrase B-, and HSP90-like ATPase [Clostridium magnum DSM 2767]